MKRFIAVIISLVIFIAFTGCAAHVNMGKDDQNMVKFDQIGGYASPERGLRILEEQTYVQERQELWKIKKILYTQLATVIQESDSTTAIDSTRVEEIEKIQKAIQIVNEGFSGVTTKEYRYLGIRNSDPEYAIQIKNGPFAGKYLNPGEKAHTKKPFPVGVFPLQYKWYRVGSNFTGTNTINVSIGEYRTADIMFNPR